MENVQDVQSGCVHTLLCLCLACEVKLAHISNGPGTMARQLERARLYFQWQIIIRGYEVFIFSH